MYLLVAKKKSQIRFVSTGQFIFTSNEEYLNSTHIWETWIQCEQEKMKIQANFPENIFSIISLRDILKVMSVRELKKITKKIALS